MFARTQMSECLIIWLAVSDHVFECLWLRHDSECHYVWVWLWLCVIVSVYPEDETLSVCMCSVSLSGYLAVWLWDILVSLSVVSLSVCVFREVSIGLCVLSLCMLSLCMLYVIQHFDRGGGICPPWLIGLEGTSLRMRPRSRGYTISNIVRVEQKRGGFEKIWNFRGELIFFRFFTFFYIFPVTTFGT